MLELETNEYEIIKHRGLSASTFMAQPFWIEIVAFLDDQIRARLQAMEEAKNASPEIKANMVDRWLITKELVSRIERFPMSAVEAARELGENR